jgi:cytochrome c
VYVKELQMRAGWFIAITVSAAGTLAGAARAEGDAEAGELTFKKCRPCHSLGQPKRNTVGPDLTGVVGRKAANVAEFRGYSEPMKKLGEAGFIWTEQNLSRYLEEFGGFLAGTKPGLLGIRDKQERENLIAYLRKAGN